jgi:serine/threonine protein phosphatase PrpC
MRLRAGAATDVGLARANNQDQMLVATPIFAVADGMGGHAAGEVASLAAVDALRSAFEGGESSPEAVVEAAQAANRAVWNRAQAHAELRGMGTTLTAVALVASAGVEVMAVINIGDSRTYRFRDGALEQVTVDHSYVAELVAGGQINEEEAEVHPQRHVLTRALGVAPEVDVDLVVLDPRPGDRFLLCSDGLSREVTDSQVASVLRRLADPDEAARELVTQAKLHGGNDNITVVVVDMVDDGAPEATVEDGPTAALPVGYALAAAEAAGAPEANDDRAAADSAGPDARSGRRRRSAAAKVPRARVVTVRVVAFVLLLAVLVLVAAAGTEYYARDTYYVGLKARQLTIFKGRPGGVLWWKPTVAVVTGVTIADVDAYHLASLQAGVQESSVSRAHAYVSRLQAEKATASAPPPIVAAPQNNVPRKTATTNAVGAAPSLRAAA